MQTDNLELKKLVYLYLMNYAKSQPDMAIMAVNTFVKVSTPEHISCLYDFYPIAVMIKNLHYFKFSNLFLNSYKGLCICFIEVHL